MKKLAAMLAAMSMLTGSLPACGTTSGGVRQDNVET